MENYYRELKNFLITPQAALLEVTICNIVNINKDLQLVSSRNNLQ